MVLDPTCHRPFQQLSKVNSFLKISVIRVKTNFQFENGLDIKKYSIWKEKKENVDIKFFSISLRY